MDNRTKAITIAFGSIYTAAVFIAVFEYQMSVTDLLTIFLFVGVGFSFLAWILTKNIHASFNAKNAGRNESLLLVALLAWIVLYITYGGNLINSLLPKTVATNEQWQFFVVILRKLFVFVLIPYLAYRTIGFSLRDFGFMPVVKTFSKQNVFLLVVMTVAVLLFEYFLSEGAKPVRDSQFSPTHLMVAIPLSFLWLFIEAGLVEEFFFRAILQSRLAVFLKSEWGAILLGGLIFGLAHVPGLYLRGGESEGINEQLPVWFWLSYCVANMSIAGIFLGIIWSKTRNIYLVMILHTMVDLLPNVSSLIHTWNL